MPLAVIIHPESTVVRIIHESLVPTRPSDRPVRYEKDHICFCSYRRSMRDENERAGAPFAAQRFDRQTFADGIKRRGGLIKDDHRHLHT